jgi:hypothetical protein
MPAKVGQLHRMTIASTLFPDKVGQLVGSKDR